MGIIGLIFGIISLITCWLGFLGWFGLIPAIVGFLGIIFSAVGRSIAAKNNKSTGAATAGLVLSIIGMIIGSIGLIACVVCAGAAAGAASSFW